MIKVEHYIVLEEKWKPIEGYEGVYEVSNMGRVRMSGKRQKNKILTPVLHRCGYVEVRLTKDGKRKNKLLHRIVAKAFIPNPNNLRTVNHRDEDKTNNSISNLEWMSSADNHNYGTRNLRAGMSNTNDPKRSKPVLQYSLEGEFIKEWASLGDVKRAFHCMRSTITRACDCQRGSKTALGYQWRFKNAEFIPVEATKIGSVNRKVSQYSLDGNLVASYESMRLAQRETGVDRASINRCCKGTQETAGGYRWKYVDQE